VNNKILLYLAVLLIIAGAVYWWPSDEKKINNRLASIAEYCTSEKEDSVIETLQKAALATEICTDPCKVHIDSFKIDREFSHKEFTDQFLLMKKRLPNTHFSFHDSIINIASDNSAQITTTLRLNGKAIDEQFTDAYEITITMEKQAGDWYFSSFTVVEFMKK